ncbi:RNA ligase partner protein [Thermodesulfobacterium sp. TA1]|uniref:RNA ligase partner protein n=1 Tax=Thermodesulfobacterium sp. TA1 TaxID=2234087 RepID=UPI0012328DB3|nr:RNA ligase partner protein [Thermodesulfobacterium sp. TA1]QER41807.1 RNA ligase partner protein [Thermodesulfobacterium sp. TA1]
MEKERLVPDTSIFTNPDVYKQFGENPSEAFTNFLLMVAELEGEVNVYIPSSVFEELKRMLSHLKLPPKARSVLKVKSPKKYELYIPAFLMYEFIEELRNRINKGLRIAEEAVKASTYKKPEEVLKFLRRRYREVLREGIVDSKEDLEIILLALELDALVLSADRGVLNMADKLGLRYLEPQDIKETLEGFKLW